jgi:hypothetical protein
MHSNSPARGGWDRSSLHAASGSWFVIPLDDRMLGIAMHVLASPDSRYDEANAGQPGVPDFVTSKCSQLYTRSIKPARGGIS